MGIYSRNNFANTSDTNEKMRDEDELKRKLKDIFTFSDKYVIKRDGTIVPFNSIKIIDAINKARKSVGIDIENDPDNKAYKKMIDNIIEELTDIYIELDMNQSALEIPLEKIQDIVNDHIWVDYNSTVGREYATYRYRRELERSGNIITKYKKRVETEGIENSNANVDEASFSGREKEAASDVSKYIALNTDVLSKEVAQAHKDMLIYQHDCEKAPFGQHNCLFPRFDKVLANGFATRNGDIRQPKSVSSALQQMAVIIQCQSQVQFGGAGALHIDRDLAPYVKMSFAKHFKKAVRRVYSNGVLNKAKYNKYKKELAEVKELSICDSYWLSKFPKAIKYAMEDLNEEGRQGAEAFYHNLNTLESRPGSQVPFSSINLGKDTSPEGRLVNKWIFETSIEGIGSHHATSIFPISIFSWKQGVNANPGDPNYDLKKLAIESLSKRIYPNFANCDWSQAHEDPTDPDTDFGTMGCRTLVGYDRNGCGYKRNGRGNNVPCTVILPQVAMKFLNRYGKSFFDAIINGEDTRIMDADMRMNHISKCREIEDAFMKYFDSVLALTEKALMERFSTIAKQSPKAGPFMYNNETIVDADKCEKTVYNAVKHNTMAFGYIGIAEMCEILFGTNHVHDAHVAEFALNIVKHINEYAADASDRHNLNFSCYATPAEGLCFNAMKALKSQYGEAGGIFSRSFLTNSHHVPVWEAVSILDKLRIEAPFTKYATGGCITYIEVDSTFVKNTEAIEKIIDYAFKKLDIPYLAINFPIDTCTGCGFTGEIEDACPECGCTERISLRRVTGYLSRDYRQFNDGKKEEVESRYTHSILANLDDLDEI